MINKMRTTSLPKLIDVNADLGEGGAFDAAILQYVSSANIACGGHAGDEHSMRRAIQGAKQNGVAAGAHPSFPDPAHFGRVKMHIDAASLYASVRDQLLHLSDIASQENYPLSHLKPHGALYHQAAYEAATGALLIQLIHEHAPHLALCILAGSPLVAQARSAGVRVIEEAFADRAYQADGSLVPRSQAGACLEHDQQAVAQALCIAKREPFAACNGQAIQLRADSLCLHGDGAHALQLTKAVRAALMADGFEIRANKI